MGRARARRIFREHRSNNDLGAAMTKADLLNLAARVEAAEGADRLLDTELENVLGLARFTEPHAWRADVDSDKRVPARAYTASLDAAASLVPEGWECALYWGVKNFAPEAQLERQDRHEIFSDPLTGTAATPALALTAAALRAMAEEAPDA